MDIFNLAMIKRPDKENKELWNASWEKDLKQAYSKLQRQLPNIKEYFPDRERHMTEGFKRTTIAENKSLHDDHILYQRDFRAEAALSLVSEGLAEKWTALTVEARRHHALEGLLKVSMAGTFFELSRSWCPDMTVAALADNPRSFLDQVNVLVNGPNDAITQFPNPFIDKILKRTAQLDAHVKEPELTLSFSIKMGRTVFVTLVLRRIYWSFKGINISYRVDREYKREKVKNFKPAESASLEEKNAHETFMKELKKMRNVTGGDSQTCWSCGIDERQLPPGITLQACARCRKINRKVLYCSKECQKYDWQNGVGSLLPHKDVCGNPARQLSESRPPKPSMSNPFGTVDSNVMLKEVPASNWLQVEQGVVMTPGRFKSSAALLQQKNSLKRPNDPDYSLFWDPLELPVRIPEETFFKAEFAEAKRRAMENGDAVAVRRMREILKPFVERYTPVEYDLAKQLKAEYGVELPECRGKKFSVKGHIYNLERN